MNSTQVAKIFFMALLVLLLSIVVFHFWVFPTLIEVLSGIQWINITASFTNGLYWLIIGLIVFFAVRSLKVTFNE